MRVLTHVRAYACDARTYASVHIFVVCVSYCVFVLCYLRCCSTYARVHV